MPKWLRPILVGIGVAAGLFTILILTLFIFRLPVEESLRLLATGAFQGKIAWSRTLVKLAPLLLTALGAAIAWRAGMYNIGGEGQLLIGTIGGTWIAQVLLASKSVPAPIVTILILLASALFGGAWAWIAGWLFVRRNVEVVISTILLNFVAIQLLSWVVRGPLQEAKHQLPLSEMLPDSVTLWRPERRLEAHLGIVWAILAAFILWVVLFRTKWGFKIRVAGDNPRVARANLMNAPRLQVQALMLSGALCGLAGGIEYAGVAFQLSDSANQSWGFLGIPVALLGGLHPLGCIPSALYFGALIGGSENLARFTPAGTTLIFVIQAAAVLGLVAIRDLGRRRKLEAGTA